MVVRALTATSHTGARWRRAVANRVAIAEADAIGPLVGMLGVPMDGVRTSAAEALGNLAANNGARLCSPASAFVCSTRRQCLAMVAIVGGRVVSYLLFAFALRALVWFRSVVIMPACFGWGCGSFLRISVWLSLTSLTVFAATCSGEQGGYASRGGGGVAERARAVAESCSPRGSGGACRRAVVVRQ